MSPGEYGRLAHEQIILDINKMIFEQQTGQFIGQVYMSPEEYSRYTEDNRLPSRYNDECM